MDPVNVPVQVNSLGSWSEYQDSDIPRVRP